MLKMGFKTCFLKFIFVHTHCIKIIQFLKPDDRKNIYQSQRLMIRNQLYIHFSFIYIGFEMHFTITN